MIQNNTALSTERNLSEIEKMTADELIAYELAKIGRRDEQAQLIQSTNTIEQQPRDIISSIKEPSQKEFRISSLKSLNRSQINDDASFSNINNVSSN